MRQYSNSMHVEYGAGARIEGVPVGAARPDKMVKSLREWAPCPL